MKKTLEEIGIDGSRVRMFNLSSAMAPEFARIAREMTETVAELGPLAGDGPACGRYERHRIT